MDIDTRLLRTFLVVAKELHFTRAAEILDMAQPVLTQHIQRLEAALGTQLFVRTSRRVSLTDAGRLMANRFEFLIAQVDRDLDDVVRVGHGEEGRLDIGVVSSALVLGPIGRIEAFRRRFPRVEIRIREGFTAALIEQLRSGEVDVATVRDPEAHSGLSGQTVLREKFVIVLPAGHELSRQRKLRGSDLACEGLVFFPERAGSLAYTRNLQPITESGHTPRVVQEASTWGTIINLVSAGLGVTICPQSAALNAPASVVVRDLVGTAARSCVVTLHRESENRAVVRRYLELDTDEL
ncbi:MAG: LysR substrate-binding domain-containing protein [Gammaproteobacteria bacterium]